MWYLEFRDVFVLIGDGQASVWEPGRVCSVVVNNSGGRATAAGEGAFEVFNKGCLGVFIKGSERAKKRYRFIINEVLDQKAPEREDSRPDSGV